jgi:Protein of unknown function (DUF1176)
MARCEIFCLSALLVFAVPAIAEDVGKPAETVQPVPTAETPSPSTDPAVEASDSVPPVDWSLRAKEAFAATYKEACPGRDPAEPLTERVPDIYEMKYQDAFDAPDLPYRTLTLYRFFCGSGAYNENHVFFMRTDALELQPVTFAEPTIHVDYENEESEEKVLAVKIIGMHSSNQLVNSTVDAGKNQISSFSKWRGVGDASTGGTWVLKDGAFVLSTYDVDASFDNEINPTTIVDYRAENEAVTETP